MRTKRWATIGFAAALMVCVSSSLAAQGPPQEPGKSTSRMAGSQADPGPRSASYAQVQQRLAQGWNTWDVHSVTTHVLLPEGLAIRVGMKHNTTEGSDAYLGDALIGRQQKGAEVVTPGPHAWDGSYTDLRVDWEGHSWSVQSAHDGADLVILVTPLESKGASALPPTIVFSVGTVWDLHAGMVAFGGPGPIVSTGTTRVFQFDCTRAESPSSPVVQVPVDTPYLAADLTGPVGISAQQVDVSKQKKKPPKTLTEIQAVIERQRRAYEDSIKAAGKNGPIVDAVETTLGWDTIYDPEKQRVISPVSRVWSVGWGGYVLFDWDTFFAATLASIGDRDLTYANAMEILRESTPQGFVPNYARAGGWKSSDRSEPPVGAITVLGLYKQFHEKWFLEDTYQPLMKWNRWWAEHRDIQGYLTWGSDPQNQPHNLDDDSVGTWQGAIFESGLDNSPMYDGTTYNTQSHLLEFADVGLMSMYIADCDALAQIADELHKSTEAKELRDRGARYRAKLATMWDEKAGMFLNVDLHKGEKSLRIAPTNFYPLLAHAATADQAQTMLEKHLLNPKEFWGEWVIPAIARDDPAFDDQEYWRGRIWGPMNYLVYLGLANYEDGETRRQFAQKSYELFLKEWKEKGHVHENYNAKLGTGDDVSSSDRFYHWGALLGYVEFLEQSGATAAGQPVH